MALAKDPKTGEYKYWDGSAWVPSRIAEKPETKERFAWDGTGWKALPKPPSGFKAAVSSGIDALQQQLYSAGEGAAGALGLEGLAKSAGEAAARNKAEAAAALPEQMQFGKAESLGDYYRAAKEALGTSLPQMAPSVVAGALTGAAAGSAVPVLGTGVGALLGGTLAGLPQFFGANRERQKEENAGVVKSEGAALLAAVPQAAMDSLLGKFIPGAGRAVTGGLLTRAVKSGAEGVITEVPTEVGQSILERLQAGLPIDDDEAIGEYKEAAIAAGILGGGIGGVSGAAQKRAMTPEELRALAGQEQEDTLQQNIDAARVGLTPTAPAVSPPASSITPPAATTATGTPPPAAPAGAAPAAAPATGATAPNVPEPTAAAPAGTAQPKPAKPAKVEAPKGEKVSATFLNEDGTEADVAQEMQLIGNEPDGRPILITPDGLTIRPRPDRIKISPLEVTANTATAPAAATDQQYNTYTPEEIESFINELGPNTRVDVREFARNLGANPNQIRDVFENNRAMTRAGNGFYIKDFNELPPPPDLSTEPTETTADTSVAQPAPVPSEVQAEAPPPAPSKKARPSQAQPDTLSAEQEAVLEQAINAMPAGARTINTKLLREQLGFKAIAIVNHLKRMEAEGRVEKVGNGPYMRPAQQAEPVAPAAPVATEAPAAQPAAEARPNPIQTAFDLARDLARKTQDGEAVDPLDFADQYNLDPGLAREVLQTNPLFTEEEGIFFRNSLPASEAVAAPVTPAAPAVKPLSLIHI